MKKIFFALVVTGTVLFSCKKDNASQPEDSKIQVSDANAVSTAIKAFHGEKLDGNPPSPSGGSVAPVLDIDSDDQTIFVKAGGYAVITPFVSSGEIAGYYFKVKGSDTYFKIDYSKPRGERRAIQPAGDRSREARRFFPKQETSNLRPLDNNDSLLVIKIPDNIGTGTFCADYWAYDYQNNVSNVISVCITVNELGGGADGSGFTGSWRCSGYKEDTAAWRYDGILYASFSNMICTNDTLTYGECNNQPGCAPIRLLAYYDKQIVFDFDFALNGGFDYNYHAEYYSIDVENSTCSNLEYSKQDDYVDNLTGAWSYNATDKKFTFIYDWNINDTEAPGALQGTIVEKSDTKFVLYLKDPYDDYEEWYEFSKK